MHDTTAFHYTRTNSTPHLVWSATNIVFEVLDPTEGEGISECLYSEILEQCAVVKIEN